VRLYEPSDYETVKAWWIEWGWQPVPEASLPQIGAIIDGKAAAWLYQTDSNLAIIDWFITSKDKEGREEAKQTIIEGLTNAARRLGYGAVITFVRNPHLIKSFEHCGFTGRDDGITNLGKAL
jgi:hypothetical protein